MSTNDNPATNADAARNKAEADKRQGLQPADTSTWAPASRIAYESTTKAT